MEEEYEDDEGEGKEIWRQDESRVDGEELEYARTDFPCGPTVSFLPRLSALV